MDEVGEEDRAGHPRHRMVVGAINMVGLIKVGDEDKLEEEGGRGGCKKALARGKKSRRTCRRRRGAGKTMGWSRAEAEACRDVGDGGLMASSVRGCLLLLLLLCMVVVTTANTAAACPATATASQGR